MRTKLLFVLCGWFLVACGEQSPADRAIDQSMEAHGVQVLDNAHVTFDFRGDQFAMIRQTGRFRYERSYSDTTDVLTNDGPSRYVGGAAVQLTEDEAYDLETTVNSVVYFAFLPYRLDDPAVRSQHLGSRSIHGELYDEVEVTFAEEGGGRDHDDRFIYWFHEEDSTLDYVAYYYFTDDGGSRFRSAQNRREVEGVLVQDYQNYVTDPDTVAIDELEEYAEWYEADDLDLVSEIELENVTIRPLE